MAELIGVRSKALLIIAVLLIVIMAFTGFVNHMTFTDNYNHSLARTYAVAGQEFVRNIEYALFYGKPIDNYYGMNDTLRELQEVVSEVEFVQVVSPKGDILYDVNGFVAGKQISSELVQAASFQRNTIHERLSYQMHAQYAYLFVGINNEKAEHVASLMMVFPKEQFIQWSSQITLQLVLILVAIATAALVVFAFIFLRTEWFYTRRGINKKRMILVLLVIIGTAQLLYSTANYVLFEKSYVDMAQTSKEFVQSIAERNIESINEKGLTLDNITGFDVYLHSIRDSLPQINEIREHQGTIEVAISEDYIRQQMNRILLDMGTVLIVSIFFMVEMTLLVIILLTRASTNGKNRLNPVIEMETATSHGLTRSLAFFINFCAFMPLTFLPIVMRHIYEPIAFLSKDVVLGLPLSAEMFGGIVAIVLAGWLIGKNGWRSVFYLGILFLIIGNVMSGYGLGAAFFILSRAVAGLGLGFILMTMRSLVASMKESNAGIAAFAAGAIAGLNCGAVIGGMLADRIGYEAVFTLAALIAFIPFLFVQRAMAGFEIEKRNTETVSALSKFTQFIKDKKTFLFLVCIFIPFFIGNAFLDYYFPLFASAEGLTQSDISRGFLLNGLIIIYLGPILTRYVLQKFGNVLGMIASLGIIVIALAVYVLYGTVVAAFVTVALLGIAESFGLSLNTTQFLNSKGMKDMQINQGVAYFSIMVNMSRMAGPIVFGVALSLGTRMGVGVIAGSVLFLLLVYVWQQKDQMRPGFDSGLSHQEEQPQKLEQQT